MTTQTKESWHEQLDRVRAMIQDDGETWDLSENDRDALRALLHHARNTEQGQMRAEIEAAWKAIANGYDIEPREYFEREAPKNGFKYPLVMALHHIWKRATRESAATGGEGPTP